MASRFLVAVLLSLLSWAALADVESTRLTDAQQCRIRQLSASRPSQVIRSEGGETEIWDDNEDQFQCTGVAAMRNRIRPNSLSLPNFHPSPRLVYVERGRGLIGITFPGCAETFQSSHQFQRGQQQQEDQHQRVQRIRQGDIIVLEAGVSHWCLNDGSEDLVAVAINDLRNEANQLSPDFRAFYLAGGIPRKEQQAGQHRFGNVLRELDENLLAETANVPVELVRKLQREDERGIIVKLRERVSVIRPDEGQEREQYEGRGNGIEETRCNMKIRANIDSRKDADIYSRQAGRINILNENKLPSLRFVDMSAEKINLFPNAILAPHWQVRGHSIIYVTSGDAHVQVVGNNGQRVLNDRVKQGDIFVVPQNFVATAKAGPNGFDSVSFKTTSLPMNSPIIGYTSVFRALPLQIITNSYQVSRPEALSLKHNRASESFLFSSQTRRSN